MPRHACRQRSAARPTTLSVFNWDSPHHMGTCGLQADDFALLGFAEYELIVASGIDPLESRLVFPYSHSFGSTRNRSFPHIARYR